MTTAPTSTTLRRSTELMVSELTDSRRRSTTCWISRHDAGVPSCRLRRLTLRTTVNNALGNKIPAEEAGIELRKNLPCRAGDRGGRCASGRTILRT